MAIERFAGKYEFLSNFYPSKITYHGHKYRTVEHAFQAMKAPTFEEHEQIRKAKTPGEAKKMGRMVRMPYDWDMTKYELMLELVRRKFKIPRLRKRLLDTGDEILVEGNTWGDRYWGKCRGSGENNLGKILMKVRQEIRNEMGET